MRVYEFADFRLNPQERVLYRRGQPVQLAPKVFDTLLALVARHGRLVSKETLMEEIWGDCFVEENNLTQHIFTLRRVLGEKKDDAKFIETVPRRGYRFTAEVYVTEISDLKSEPSVEREIHTTAPAIHETPPRQPLAENFDAEKSALKKIRIERLFAFGFVVLLLAISLGFAFRFGWRQNSLASNSREVRFKRLTEDGNLFGVGISPDGNSLAYVAIDGKNYSVRLRNILTESEIVVVPPVEGVIVSPRFSPDGNFIYYSQALPGNKGVIYQIPVLGGQPRQIASNIWSGFSVSPDGREVAFPRRDTATHVIVIAAADGSGERIVATRNEPDFYALWGPAPVWSPDGEHLTVVTGRFGESGNGLAEISLTGGGGEEREIKTQSGWNYIDSIGWASKNELIVAAQEKNEEKEQLWRVTFPGGAVERLTNDFQAYEGLDLAKDASKLVALKVTEDLHLWLFDKETSTARQLTSGENRVDGSFGLALAPDGRVVFTARNKNEYDIFSLDPGSGETRQLTKNAGRVNSEPSVSPDNRFIAFISDRSGLPRLWLMKRDGAEARQLTPLSDDKQIEEHTPYFSPDGLWIYYTFCRNGHNSIYKIPVSGDQEPAAVTNPGKEAFAAAVSPDGKFLAFGSHDDKAKHPWHLRVQSFDDSEKEKFLNFPAFRFNTRWTPDSQSLISIEQSFHGANLWKTNIETNQRQQITNFNAGRIFRFDQSRDGRFYVVSRGNVFYDAVLIER